MKHSQCLISLLLQGWVRWKKPDDGYMVMQFASQKSYHTGKYSHGEVWQSTEMGLRQTSGGTVRAQWKVIQRKDFNTYKYSGW